MDPTAFERRLRLNAELLENEWTVLSTTVTAIRQTICRKIDDFLTDGVEFKAKKKQFREMCDLQTDVTQMLFQLNMEILDRVAEQDMCVSTLANSTCSGSQMSINSLAAPPPPTQSPSVTSQPEPTFTDQQKQEQDRTAELERSMTTTIDASPSSVAISQGTPTLQERPKFRNVAEQRSEELCRGLELPDFEVRRTSPVSSKASSSRSQQRSSSSRLLEETHSSKSAPEFVATEYKMRHPTMRSGCTIAYFESPCEFYIHLANDADALRGLEENLRDGFTISDGFSKTKVELRNLTECYVGLLAEWDQWYRVKVIDWQGDSTEMIKVLAVDFGDQYTMSYHNLRMLTRELAEPPKFAVPCKFHSLYSPSSTIDGIMDFNAEELHNVNSWFNAHHSGEVFFEIVFIGYENETPLGIDLVRLDDDDPENSLGKEMMDRLLVVEILEPPQSICNPVIQEQLTRATGWSDESDPRCRMESYLMKQNYDEAANIVEDVAGYDAQDEARICPFTTKDKTCFKGKHCRLEHSQLRKDGVTTDKQMVYYEAESELTLPATGAKIELQFMVVVSLREFYAHVMRLDTQYDFDALTRFINRREAVARYKRLSIAPGMGEIVLALSAKYGAWYRARVESVIKSDLQGIIVTVFLVDRGNTEDLPISSITEICGDYLVTPFLAVRCFLSGLRVIRGQSEGRKYMQEHFESCKYNAHVVSSSTFLYVDVMMPDEQSTISRHIIEKGLAQPSDNIIADSNGLELID